MREQITVVKYGSKSISSERGVMLGRLDTYARQLSRLPGGLIVVTSGAVKAGRAEVIETGRQDIVDDQVLAGIGGPTVFMGWKLAFRKAGRVAGETLATDHEILDDPLERDTLQVALRKDLAHEVVPIINTNDKLSVDELPKRRWGGENDALAAHIAQLVGATTLCLLTKRNGLFDQAGKTVPAVAFDADEHARAMVLAGRRNEKGQGMPAKVEAAIQAASAGIDVFIAGADQDISRVIAGETGTHFAAVVLE